MKIYLTVFFLLFARFNFDSLNRGHIDSLKPLVGFSITGNTQKDTTNINRLNDIARNYFETNPDSTIYFGTVAVNLSRQIKYSPGLAYGLLQVGHADFFKGNYDKARKEFNQSISIFKDEDDKRGLSQVYEWYGKMQSQQANYAQAINFLNLATNLNKQIANKAGMASCYKNTGMVYFGEGRLPAALDFYYKALFIDLKADNKTEIADIYNNIGDVLQNMESYPRALEYYKKALTEANEAKDLLEVGTASENIGEVLLAQKKYDEAAIYLNTSLKIAKKQDDKDGISYISADLGLCYAYQGNKNEADTYLKTALAVARESKIAYNEAFALISYSTFFNLQKDFKNACKFATEGEQLSAKLGNVWFRANAAMELYKCYAGEGKFQEAFKYSLLYNGFKDSLKVNEGLQKLTSYNLTLNFTAKQQQLALEQHEKEVLYTQKIKQQKINATFEAVIILMVIISIFYYRQKRRQQKTIEMLGDKNAEIMQKKMDLDEQARKLNDSNLLKDKLIAILAHDLRAPLSTLRGVFALLLDNEISISDVLDMVPTVIKKLEYTSDFLDTLLFWINSQVENFGNSVKSFYLKDIVDFEITNLADNLKSKDIRMVDSVGSDAFILADPDSIRVVLRNMVTNAIKFSRNGDKIEILSRLHVDRYTADTYYVISVKDTGIGMSDEQLSRLFKGKVNSGVGTNNESGTGMGMLFCRDLIERCGGKIWVASKKGVGTEFSFSVPVGVRKSQEEKLEIAC